MKVGIISDIHSDLNALRDALKLLEDQQVDQIICCGDVIHAFRHMSHNNEVIDILLQNDVLCVLGNHDEAVLAGQRDLRGWNNIPKNLQSRRLNDKAFNFLANRPDHLTFHWYDKIVAVTHGTLDGLHPNNDAHIFETFTQSIVADISLVGHTHSPLQAKIGNVWIFNPGSICGTHYAGSRTCAILQLPENNLQVFGLDDGTLIETPILDFDS